MQKTSRRNLRNSNTCPIVPNSFHRQNDNQTIQNFIPNQIFQQIANLPTISCSQISQLPILTVSNTIEQALDQMKQAQKWQDNHSFTQEKEALLVKEEQHSQRILEEPHNQPGTVIEKYRVRKESDKILYEVLFENQLGEFVESHYHLSLQDSYQFPEQRM